MGYFLLRHVLTVFVKEDIVNVSVEGYVRKEQREEKARLERRGQSCSLERFGSRLSPRMEKTTKEDINKKARKKGIRGEI